MFRQFPADDEASEAAAARPYERRTWRIAAALMAADAALAALAPLLATLSAPGADAARVLLFAGCIAQFVVGMSCLASRGNRRWGLAAVLTAPMLVAAGHSFGG